MKHKILNKPVIEYVIEKMITVCDSLRIVTGYKKEKLEYIPSRYKAVRLIFNDRYPFGMFSSVLAGLGDLEGERAMIIPGDCPAVSLETFQQMAEITGEILVPCYNGTPGHPVCISKDFVMELLNSDCTTLREFIKRYGFREVNVEDQGILMDIDYFEDFLKIENYMRSQNND